MTRAARHQGLASSEFDKQQGMILPPRRVVIKGSPPIDTLAHQLRGPLHALVHISFISYTSLWQEFRGHVVGSITDVLNYPPQDFAIRLYKEDAKTSKGRKWKTNSTTPRLA
ncbi:putative homoserine O-acetyltransferase [Microsporum audouinii]